MDLALLPRAFLRAALSWLGEPPPGPAPPAPPEAAPALNSPRDLLERVESMERTWEQTVMDLDEVLERLEVKRRRIAATESKLAAREKNNGAAEAADNPLGQAYQNAKRMGLI